MKYLTIPANQTSINFDNVVTGAFPDLVIVSLVSDADPWSAIRGTHSISKILA